MSCNRRTLCSCWPLVLAALTVGSLSAKAAEPPHEGTSSSRTISQAPSNALRWAILGSQAVRESGICDLLTAKLSEMEGIELVERERLEAISKEQQLSGTLGASGVNQRVQLGRFVGTYLQWMFSLLKKGKDLKRLRVEDIDGKASPSLLVLHESNRY